MKHCAKKLLGLAFALALCLAVGGTALAQTPELADVPAALPEQEMLDYEPYAAPAADVPNIVKGDGYTVTIPTTVEVKSGDNTTGTLMVKAQLKQYRTLNIGIESKNDWKLQYDGATAGTTTPKVDYKLSQGTSNDVAADCEWRYEPEGKKLSFSTTKMTPGTSLEADMERFGSSSYELPITVPTPSQATMSGTYSDTLEFTFSVEKKLVTYTIKAYGQKLALTGNSFDIAITPKLYTAIHAVDVVGADGTAESGAELVSTVTVEYPSDGGAYTWTRLRPAGTDKDEDERCWEDLTCTLNPATDFAAGETTKTINLNLERKWCWLDVNGVTEGDSGDLTTSGTQGTECIAGRVDIRVSADNGATWSGWYWYRYGDDYWGTFPYGTVFQLGLHHLKDGYVYDEDAPGGNVKIYANGTPTQQTTKLQKSDGKTTYRVYQGKLTGEPVDKTLHTKQWDGYYHDGIGDKALPRYCYNPCYKKGITYDANGGTGGTEDTFSDFKWHSNVPYDENGTLKTTDELNITPPAGKSLAGWSTSADYPKTGELYKPGDKVSKVNWGADYPEGESLKRRPEFGGEPDKQNRTLYAIWGYDIKVEFEDEKGYSKNNGTSIVPMLGGTMSGCSFTLKGQVVADGADWTLDLTDPTVKTAIEDATTQAKSDAEDTDTKTGINLERKIWKIDKYEEGGHKYDFTADCTLSAEEVKNGKPLVIQRRRYLLSVISVDVNTDIVNGIATNAGVPKFGTFNVTINDGKTDLGVTGKSHCQVGLNYGAKYTVDTMQGKAPYYAIHAVIPESLTVNNKINLSLVEYGASYTSHMTGKQTGIHYYTGEGALADNGYKGDPVRVVFSDTGNTTGSTTPKPGPSLAPAKKALTLRYHANFDPNEELALDLDPDPLLDDMDDTFGFDPDPLPEDVLDPLVDAVKTVTYKPGEDVVLRNCMFKRGGYVFVGWNTEEDGTGKGYEVNGLPITDWAAGDTVDLYAQWKKPAHLKPVWDDPDPTDPAEPIDPAAPPEDADTAFGVDPAQPEELDAAFGVDPAPQPEALDDAFGVDPAQPEELDAAFGVDPAPPEELDAAFGVDPAPPEELDAAFGVDPAPPEELDAAFGVDPDPLPDELDDAFSV